MNSTSASPAPVPARAFSHPGWLAVILGLLTVVVYWPATGNGFINLDDNLYVQSNVQVQQGLTLKNIGWAFTHTVSCNWHPLTMMSHMIDCQLFGLNPWGHHLTSVLIHAANTILLFLLFYRLTASIWGSAWVGAVFAFHPLHVESVAWVAERKDVLSAFFGFLTLLFYVRHIQAMTTNAKSGNISHRPARDYWLACLCYALGLMSKPMLVTWPFVLLLLDYWPLGRFQSTPIRTLIREKIPFFVLTMAACLVTFVVQNDAGATQNFGTFPFVLRCLNAVMSYGRYILKIFWPADLAVYYPYPALILIGWALLVAILLAGTTVIFWSQRRHYPFLLVGWLWFIGTLVPVIGLIQVGTQAIADRYTYIPSVGIFLLISWGASQLAGFRRQHVLLLSVIAVAVLILCADATRRQIGQWKDNETLYRHTLAITDHNALAHNNLAASYVEQGRTDEAIVEFREVLRINPRLAETHINLGRLLVLKGQTNQAISDLLSAVETSPTNPDVRCFLGSLLLQNGQTDEGIGQFRQVVRFQTNDARSFQSIVNLLLVYGQTNAAINQLKTAIMVIPADPDFHIQLGNLLLNIGQTDESAGNFLEALRLKPDSSAAHNGLASVRLREGKIDQAVAELQASIRLQPEYANTHFNLGALYLKQGRIDEAAEEFQTVIRLASGFAPAHYYYGNILIRKSQPAAAIAQYQQAIRLQPDYPPAHNKLGIALGSTGHLPEAIAEFQEAIRLQPDYAEASTNLAIALKMRGAAGP